MAFRINGHGTRKHVEARLKRRFKNTAFTSSPRLEILPAPAADTRHPQCSAAAIPAVLRPSFRDNCLLRDTSPEDATPALRKLAATAATDLNSPISNLQLPSPKFLCQIPSPQIHLHPTKLA